MDDNHDNEIDYGSYRNRLAGSVQRRPAVSPASRNYATGISRRHRQNAVD
jgi:hypothetical protein